MRAIILIVLCVSSLTGFAQSGKLTISEAIDVALKNNRGLKAAAFEVESSRQLKKTNFDLPKTNVSLLYGQYNSYSKNDNNVTISQTIPFASLGSRTSLNKSLLASSELRKKSTENELVYQVKQVYYQLAFTQANQSLLLQQDSIYTGFLKSASLRYSSGETKLLEKTTAETQRNDIANQLRLNEADIMVLRTQLKSLLNSDFLPDASLSSLPEIEFNIADDSTTVMANPFLAYARQQVEVTKNLKKVEVANLAPDLLLGYFNQTLIDVVNTENGQVADSKTRFNGFQVGLAIPLWFSAQQGRIKSAEFNRQAAESSYKNQEITLRGQLDQAAQIYLKNKNSLTYYRTSALPNAELILSQVQTAFRNGDIDYAEYLIGTRNAIGIKEGYLQTLNNYNQSIIDIEFLSGTIKKD